MPVKKDGQPGPGSYKVPVQVGNVPTYSMPQRKEENKYVWLNFIIRELLILMMKK